MRTEITSSDTPFVLLNSLTQDRLSRSHLALLVFSSFYKETKKGVLVFENISVYKKMDNHGWVMNKGTIITHVTLSICVFFKILELTTYS